MSDADRWERAYRDGLHARQWDTPWPAPELAGIVSMYGTDPGAAVDIGCGTGADAIYLAQQGFEMTGVDLSRGALEIAAGRASGHGVQIEWIEGDALALPIETGSLQAAFDRGCLHHISPSSQPRHLAEIARVLEPGGRAFIRSMSADDRNKTPFTSASIVALTDGLPLEVMSSVQFEMVGPHRASPATLAVIRRI